MRLNPIAPGDRSILACILRAAEFADREHGHMPITGVHLHRHGEHIRCVATDGKGLACLHAWGGGIDLQQPITLTADSVRRVADLYRRIQPALRNHLNKNDPSKGAEPFITASVAWRPLGTSGMSPLMTVSVPKLDDGATLRAFPAGAAFPGYQHCEAKVAYKTGFLPGAGFSAAMLASAHRVLGGHHIVPCHSGRGVFLRNLASDVPDYVLVMPISLPGKDEEHWIFGRPEPVVTPAPEEQSVA